MLKALLKKLLYRGVPVPGILRPLIRASYRVGVFVVESSAFLLKLLWVEPILRSVCEHVGSGLRAERLPYVRGAGVLRFGDRVNLSGRSCFYFVGVEGRSPRISVGSDTFIGNGCTLSAADEIRIGDHVLLAAGVRVHDNDGHPLDAARRRAAERIRADEVAPVRIGDNVWIGACALILKGVSIGDDAVIGSYAVVTRDVPAGTVVAGNPARVVREADASTEGAAD